MVDQEGAGEHDQEAQHRNAAYRHRDLRIVDLPHHGRDRAPLPEHQGEREAREQHIGASLHRLRDELRPPFLELPARHDAVLDGEYRHQNEVDDGRFHRRPGRAAVEGFRNHQAGYEADGAEKRHEKHEIGDDSVQKCDYPGYWMAPGVRAEYLRLGHNILRSDDPDDRP